VSRTKHPLPVVVAAAMLTLASACRNGSPAPQIGAVVREHGLREGLEVAFGADGGALVALPVARAALPEDVRRAGMAILGGLAPSTPLEVAMFEERSLDGSLLGYRFSSDPDVGHRFVRIDLDAQVVGRGHELRGPEREGVLSRVAGLAAGDPVERVLYVEGDGREIYLIEQRTRVEGSVDRRAIVRSEIPFAENGPLRVGARWVVTDASVVWPLPTSADDR
jgi:hypothetical protein